MKTYGILTENRKVEKFKELLSAQEVEHTTKATRLKDATLIEVTGPDGEGFINQIQLIVNEVAEHFGCTFGRANNARVGI